MQPEASLHKLPPIAAIAAGDATLTAACENRESRRRDRILQQTYKGLQTKTTSTSWKSKARAMMADRFALLNSTKTSKKDDHAKMPSSSFVEKVNTERTALNVTLMDIASLSQSKIANDKKKHSSTNSPLPTSSPVSTIPKPPPIQSLLNSTLEIDRFRKLLRGSPSSVDVGEENSRSKSRVNYCDSEKSDRIIRWLTEVNRIQEEHGLCQMTSDPSVTCV